MTRAEQKPRERLDDRAFRLMQSANALIREGRLPQAAESLERAAQLHREAGRNYDEARCVQMAATVRRSVGDTETAAALVERAASIAIDDLPLAASIAAEMAETAAAQGRLEDAASRWTAAIDNGRSAGLGPDGMSALLRRRAASFIALDRQRDADADFARAFDLTQSVHGPDTAAFVLVEEANHLCAAGRDSAAETVVTRIEALTAGRPASPHLRAEWLLLRARLARSRDDTQASESHAREARSEALAAVAPVTYFAASALLAEVLEAKGQRTESYGALSTAWATLSDLLGEDVARSWVEPCVAAYRLLWGERSFQDVKSEHEARRRDEITARSSQS